MIKLKFLWCILSLSLISCQNTNKNNKDNSSSEINSILSERDSLVDQSDLNKEPKTGLALTSNALQIVNLSTGSTTELSMGMEMNALLDQISRILQSEVPKPRLNAECGAGPMTVANFENGLVLMFQPGEESYKKMQFVGWSLNEGKNAGKKLSTMSNIGIGSTRGELKAAYNVEIKKTSLGQEFSTIPGGLYGILDGTKDTSQITFMWSGLSCNFR